MRLQARIWSGLQSSEDATRTKGLTSKMAHMVVALDRRLSNIPCVGICELLEYSHDVAADFP